MKVPLQELIDKLVSTHSIKSAEEFTILLGSNEIYISEIIEISTSDYNVYFHKDTFDGWYCIEKSNDTFNVYHQERGRIGWSDVTVKGKSSAVTEVLLGACYLCI
ncbi:hypothetical protein [Gilvimarinus polysaccharolyticus]|uniref:hypothetical protein n=1 Tax=Gilvimarinus polysaccharolyticus TaxID=863921 RepID=UPI000673B33C|nr:hypothetical protein [Gilvimarinus polysaccharolyticus]